MCRPRIQAEELIFQIIESFDLIIFWFETNLNNVRISDRWRKENSSFSFGDEFSEEIAQFIEANTESTTQLCRVDSVEVF